MLIPYQAPPPVKLNPLGSRVIIKMDEYGKKTKGGLILPGATQERMNASSGWVISAGKDVSLVEAGQHVMILDYGGVDIKTSGRYKDQRWKLLHEEEILAIYSKDVWEEDEAKTTSRRTRRNARKKASRGEPVLLPGNQGT